MHGGFFKGDKKKLKKEIMEKKASHIRRPVIIPQIEIIGKKGK